MNAFWAQFAPQVGTLLGNRRQATPDNDALDAAAIPQ
jgi:hypothetical protein